MTYTQKIDLLKHNFNTIALKSIQSPEWNNCISLEDIRLLFIKQLRDHPAYLKANSNPLDLMQALKKQGWLRPRAPNAHTS